MGHPSGVRITGALAPYQDAIWADLLARGYTPLSAKNLLRLAAHLSRWLEAKRVLPSEVTSDRIGRFLKHRIKCGYTWRPTARGLQPILHPLRTLGVIPLPEPVPEDQSSLGVLFREYETYLVQDRSVTTGTAARCVKTARRFFAHVKVCDAPAVCRLSAQDVSQFVLRVARSSSVGSAKLIVSDLRSFLRFLHVRGHCGDLAAAAPAVAGYRQARLPKHVPWGEIQTLVDSCDPRTAVGQRDRAILLLLSRLGLRASEVEAIELDDIHWIAGEIVVRGKGARQDRLPLPHDVGDAVVRYLKSGRPRTSSRKLFLRSHAPHSDLSTAAIKGVVHQASRRARLPLRSAHRLRHTAATQMLRGGASLQAIAEVLRHQSLDTTAIYAKVDHLSLRPLARPWPGGDA
jgi:integrase/recombinase XerD